MWIHARNRWVVKDVNHFELHGVQAALLSFHDFCWNRRRTSAFGTWLQTTFRCALSTRSTSSSLKQRRRKQKKTSVLSCIERNSIWHWCCMFLLQDWKGIFDTVIASCDISYLINTFLQEFFLPSLLAFERKFSEGTILATRWRHQRKEVKSRHPMLLVPTYQIK